MVFGTCNYINNNCRVSGIIDLSEATKKCCQILLVHFATPLEND